MWTFALPWAFVLLPLPLIARWFLPARVEAGGALKVPASIVSRLGSGAGAEGASARAFIPCLIWIALVAAIAGPRLARESPALPASGRDMVLALDLSGSMEQADFEIDGKPARRIDVLRRAAARFVRGREGDRVGLVIFAEKAYYAAAPTFDVEAVARAIEQARIGISGKSTAISEGLGLALKRLSESTVKSRVVVLLSDGVNNGGTVRPNDAAALAKRLGIRVHTIAMGVMDLEANAGERDVVDSRTLRAIAEASGGEAFRVKTTGDLEEVAAAIDTLETSEFDVPTALVFKDLWIWPALAALALAGLMLRPRSIA